MPHRGLLDILDHVDLLLGNVNHAEGLSRADARRNQVLNQNARLAIQEARRRIERVGQETKT